MKKLALLISILFVTMFIATSCTPSSLEENDQLQTTTIGDGEIDDDDI